MRKTLSAFVVLLCLAIAIPASATQSGTASWSSTRCTNSFTTSNYIYKNSSSTPWDTIEVGGVQLSYDGLSNSSSDYLNAQPINESGVALGSISMVFPARSIPGNNVLNVNLSPYLNNVYLRIYNARSGYNMRSSGSWFGYYY